MGKFLRLINGVARQVEEAATTVILPTENTYTVVSTISSGTAVTIPNSMAYDSTDLEVFLNNARCTHLFDFNYVGASAPRTQVSFTFDLKAGDVLFFRA